MSESVILCEGYHDRAFWAGWLESLACRDPGERSDGGGRVPVDDPWMRRVTGGQFAFHSRSGKFIRITPCHGKDRILRAAESRLADRQDRELAELVLSIDADTTVQASPPRRIPFIAAVENLLGRLGEYQRVAPDRFVLDGGGTAVTVVRWEAANHDQPGIPAQQTLERLVCAALVAAYPQRGPAVQSWLDGRPEPPAPAGPKEFAWSHMAGWSAPLGCDTFYRKLWGDERVAAEMKTRLEACGAWRVAEALAQ
jgi:hypothetical protein